MASRLKGFCAETNLNNLEPLEKVLAEQKKSLWVKELDEFFNIESTKALEQNKSVTQQKKTSSTEGLDKIFQNEKTPAKNQSANAKKGIPLQQLKKDTTKDNWILGVAVAIYYYRRRFKVDDDLYGNLQKDNSFSITRQTSHLFALAIGIVGPFWQGSRTAALYCKASQYDFFGARR